MQLQQDIDALVNWSDTWQLPFNEDKCKFLHLGRAIQQPEYTMTGSQLERVVTERDLGVTVDTDLKFRKHAATAVSKASQILAFIRRSLVFLIRRPCPCCLSRSCARILNIVTLYGAPSIVPTRS